MGRQGLGSHFIGPCVGTLQCLADGGVWSLQAQRWPPIPSLQVLGMIPSAACLPTRPCDGLRWGLWYSDMVWNIDSEGPPRGCATN